MPTSTGRNARCTFSRGCGGQVPAQRQGQEEIRRGQIHSDSGKAGLEIKETMRQRNAQAHDLVFPNGKGKIVLGPNGSSLDSGAA
jgi:hypothetical protein